MCDLYAHGCEEVAYIRNINCKAHGSCLNVHTVVKKRSQGGEEELDKMRHEVGQLADNTALALKKNVYKNYSQFIETAKEISS